MNTNINIGPPGGNNPSNRSGLDPTESSQITTDGKKSVSSPASRSKSESAHPVRPVEDRVDISDAAKAKANDQDKRSRELGLARKALLGIPPLTEDKVTELQQRIRERYYAQPEVTDKVSEQIFSDLSEPTVDESDNE
jgi:hypothetical protein